MTNSNARGSAADRLRRRLWLLEAFAADLPGHVRCYRCGDLLDIDTMTVDRIRPGALGGTYRRNNIRPACSPCQTLTGNQLLAAMKADGKRPTKAQAVA